MIGFPVGDTIADDGAYYEFAVDVCPAESPFPWRRWVWEVSAHRWPSIDSRFMSPDVFTPVSYAFESDGSGFAVSLRQALRRGQRGYRRHEDAWSIDTP